MATDWDMVLTILTAITIIIIVIWNGIQYRQMKKQLEIQNQQIRLNFFQDFTNRATQLFWRLPENIYEDSFSFDDLDP
ncbi:MAG: hypothetical protein ACXAEN_14695, partial [Candidatus Thorarchaeota archaeon]